MNLTALPVPRGTISIMLNVAKKDYGFNLSSLKKRIPPKSKFKMKWKAIQWLIHNKKGLFNLYYREEFKFYDHRGYQSTL